MSGLVEQYPLAEVGQAIGNTRRRDITLRKNIDAQIEQAQERLAELQQTRERLEESNLLDTRIDDLERAMRF